MFFHIKLRRGGMDVAQQDFVQKNRAEAVRQEHIGRNQPESNDARNQAAVDFQAVEHQKQRRNNHRDKGNVDGDDVLTHHAHHKDDGKQQPFDRALARTHAVGHTAPVQLADDRAGKLLRQAGMGNRHCKRAEHRIRKRNLRTAFQTFVEHGDNPRLADLSRRIGNVLQRHTRHRAADKRADRQAQYHVHARQRQHQHNDYGNYDCIHCLSLQTYKCLHIETHHNPITENPPILQTIISNASYTSPA